MNTVEDFKALVSRNIQSIGESKEFLDLSNRWIETCIPLGYMYNFSWLGLPSSRSRRTAMLSRR